MKDWLQEYSLILEEAAVAERVSQFPGVTMHPDLFHTPLIYDAPAAELLKGIYSEYIDVARDASLPILLAAPTWRFDPERVDAAGVPTRINSDAVHFLSNVIRDCAYDLVKLGGLVGPKNDCYRGDLALDTEEAENFHAEQAAELAAAGVNFPLGQTLPAVSEAIGMARALLTTGQPSVMSFCIDPQGCVLDGTDLGTAIDEVDAATDGKLDGFMVNCMYPTFVRVDNMNDAQRARLIGCDPNGSSRVPWELEACASTQAVPVAKWEEDVLSLKQSCGLQILGGCCGTTADHLRALV